MDTLPVRSEEALRKQANGVRKGRTTPASLREQVDPEAVKIYEEAKWATPTMDAVSNRTKKYAQGGTPIAMQTSTWGTPTAMPDAPCRGNEKRSVRRGNPGGAKTMGIGPQAEKFVENWPTPRALEIEESLESHGARMEKRRAEGKQIPSENLSITSRKWPTPVKSDFQDRRASENWEGSDLPSVVDAWPTPSVCMVKGHNSEESLIRKNGTSRATARLDNAAVHVGPSSQNWLTPAAREDAACPQSQRMLTHQAKEFELCEDPTGPQDPTSGKNGSEPLPSDPTSLRLSKRLNPRFVEWLMGHPIGWSSVRKIEMKDYNAWVTESSLLLERLLSESYGKGW